MAYRATQAVAPILDQIDTVAAFPFGTRFEAADGAYVYVKGVTSGVAGDWVTFNPSSGVTVRTVANAKGKVGILMAALDATTKFGWAQVKGSNAIALSGAAVAASVPIYLHATAGTVDDAVVSGDLVANAFSTVANIGAGVFTVYINDPFVTDTLS